MGNSIRRGVICQKEGTWAQTKSGKQPFYRYGHCGTILSDYISSCGVRMFVVLMDGEKEPAQFLSREILETYPIFDNHQYRNLDF